jgi:glycosyltransferase involved in cell wall biosynthesis
MTDLRVAYTFEQCWGRVPGGTAVAALEVARQLASRNDIELIGVAGGHRSPPPEAWNPPVPVSHLGGRGAALYASWVFAGRPLVERATGTVDVAHATSLIPCASRAPLVVTVHDLAFRHVPEAFTRWGGTLFAASIKAIKRRADLVLCSSVATMDDCRQAGIGGDRLRLVPLGVVEVDPAEWPAKRQAARAAYDLPERFVLFVGTVEPRKNLFRLIEAVEMLDEPLPLIIAGATGWGDAPAPNGATKGRVRFLGFVPPELLGGLYASATVFCYPSLWEGFGLPVLEAMAHGAPVVTSAGLSTAEAAGGAAVLVDPLSVADIAAGLHEAITAAGDLTDRGLRRAASMRWSATADLTVAAYREVAR